MVGVVIHLGGLQGWDRALSILAVLLRFPAGKTISPLHVRPLTPTRCRHAYISKSPTRLFLRFYTSLARSLRKFPLEFPRDPMLTQSPAVLPRLLVVCTTTPTSSATCAREDALPPTNPPLPLLLPPLLLPPTAPPKPPPPPPRASDGDNNLGAGPGPCPAQEVGWSRRVARSSKRLQISLGVPHEATLRDSEGVHDGRFVTPPNYKRFLTDKTQSPTFNPSQHLSQFVAISMDNSTISSNYSESLAACQMNLHRKLQPHPPILSHLQTLNLPLPSPTPNSRRSSSSAEHNIPARPANKVKSATQKTLPHHNNLTTKAKSLSRGISSPAVKMRTSSSSATMSTVAISH